MVVLIHRSITDGKYGELLPATLMKKKEETEISSLHCNT